MNYMPTKSRKWLASGIATAVIASALSLFTVAPASAAGTVSTVSVDTSKPIRATSAAYGDVKTGQGNGNGTDDTPALVFTLGGTIDDDTLFGCYSATADDSEFFIRRTAAPTNSAGTANGGLLTLEARDLRSGTDLALTTLNTWYEITSMNDFFMRALGTDETLTADDSRMAVNITADTAGSYTIEYLLDCDSSDSAVPTSGDLSGTFTFSAYDAPVITVTSSVTRASAGDDTVTITATGGALSLEDTLFVVDDTTFDNTFRVKRDRVNPYGTVGGDDSTGDDTVLIDINSDWVKTGANTMTLTLVLVNPALGLDNAGTVKIWRKSGFITPATKASAATVTATASLAVNAISSLDITAPTTNILEDDTPASGVFVGTLLKSATTSGSTTVSGTFQHANVSDYGKDTTVAVYSTAEADVDITDTPILTSTVTSAAGTGVGTWSFAIPNQYLDAAGEKVTIYAGSVTVANATGSSTPKAYELEAVAAAATPVWTVNGLTFESAENFQGTLILAIGGKVEASAKTLDQFGNIIAGQSIAITTGSTSRNASKLIRSGLSTAANGVVSASMTDAGTTASTTTSTTRDSITLSMIDGLEDDTVGTTEALTVAYVTNTLTAPTLNGVAAAAYDGAPVVPGDGTASLHSSDDDASEGLSTDDSMLQFKVTSAVLGASVTFTGSSGVRFSYDDSVAPMNNSNVGGANRVIAAKKGTTKVMVASSTTTGVAEVYWYCITAGDCTVTATSGTATTSATVTYYTDAAFARDIVEVKVNDVLGTTGTSSAANKVKVSFKVVDTFGNVVKTLGSTSTVDVMVQGVGSIDGLGSQGTLKTGTDGTAQFYATSSVAGSQQILLDGSGGQFAGLASTSLGNSAAADKKTVTLTWSAAPAPEVVYAAPTLTVTKSGNKIILDGTAVEGEGDIIVYIKRVGTTKWVEQAATIEVAAPGDYNGMRIAPKSNVLIRVKQEGTGKFSNQVVVLK